MSLASFDAAQAVEHLELSEKMIRKLRAGMMPPAGARRPEAGAAHGAGRRRSRTASIAPRCVNPNPGLAAVSAAQPRRVRARRERHARHRRRRRGAAAGRHHQRRLRQRRRLAGVLADVDGKLPARRGQGDGAGDRRSRSGRHRNQLSRARRPRRSCRASRARRSARAAASRRRTRSRPTATTCSRSSCTATRAACCSADPTRASRWKSRSTASARRLIEHRPAHGRDHHRPVAEDAARAHQGRRASRDRGVHPALRRPGQRSRSRRSITRWPTRRSASPWASPRCRTSRTSASSVPTT